ncbi:TIGR02147 family protein [Pseudobacteriovorax antillogorgiicola]|uniref:TIGR02147 family protein n=1 Tax=Pseudobacteriovorax antillogorgiicola TaxID=1513793 RepID=A0A1Y6CNN3_9BACT|nr:TIGR02147 family protein [Pseudobacteriovorax antillogorgiicola]TCS44832.1 uncharacterized protein (TIGR02147 family) [Pseudobacteriovorax antillogorgiicola]SMF77139.1 TIGR02147 family protein [Pseudobacteriovorax antillogorgiicola]
MPTGRALLKKVVAEQQPTAYFSAKAFLKALHSTMKSDHGGYSYRQFADDLGFSTTNVVHLYASGKRPISEQGARRIVDALQLRKEQRQYFLKLCHLTRNLNAEDFSQTLAEALAIRASLITDTIEQRQLAFYSSWSNIVIREMVALPDFQADPKWISQKLWPKVSVKEAEEALELLKELDLIRYNKSRKAWELSSPSITTGPEVAHLAVNQYHQLSIPQGLQSLVDVEQEKRHISSLTLCINESQFDLIKKEIEAFQQRLLELEQKTDYGPSDRIVQLNMQLFPNTTE